MATLKGYECQGPWKCCQTCGIAKLKNQKRYLFWHNQDDDSARKDGHMNLAWNGNGKKIADALRAAGLEVNWNGTKGQRIEVAIRF